MNHRIDSPEAFRKTIDSALELLRNYVDGSVPSTQSPAQPLPNLLEHCQQLLAAAHGQAPTPVRILHHLAGTGGTLISRCIAAQPNTRLLSEVDPLSPFVPGGFLPTDLIGLSRFGSYPAEPETQIQLFLAGLGVLYEESTQTSRTLILRDHCHGHFNVGDAIPDRPTLREIVQRAYPVQSLVSVRHPFDSYLSLQNTGWVQHFSPPTLDEYAQRYHGFLDAYEDCPLIRYEDFVADPRDVMQRICAHLDLAYSGGFIDHFPAITLSGDYGRSGDIISPRPRRPHPTPLEHEAHESEAFVRLLARLDY